MENLVQIENVSDYRELLKTQDNQNKAQENQLFSKQEDAEAFCQTMESDGYGFFTPVSTRSGYYVSPISVTSLDGEDIVLGMPLYDFQGDCVIVTDISREDDVVHIRIESTGEWKTSVCLNEKEIHRFFKTSPLTEEEKRKAGTYTDNREFELFLLKLKYYKKVEKSIEETGIGKVVMSSEEAEMYCQELLSHGQYADWLEVEDEKERFIYSADFQDMKGNPIDEGCTVYDVSDNEYIITSICLDGCWIFTLCSAETSETIRVTDSLMKMFQIRKFTVTEKILMHLLMDAQHTKEIYEDEDILDSNTFLGSFCWISLFAWAVLTFFGLNFFAMKGDNFILDFLCINLMAFMIIIAFFFCGAKIVCFISDIAMDIYTKYLEK